MGLAAVNWMKLAPKAVILCEITHIDDQWAVHDHSMSPSLVPIESRT